MLALEQIHSSNNSVLPSVEVAELIYEFVGSHFFSLSFIKLDGSKRMLNGKLDAYTHTSKSAEGEYHMTVYDVQIQGYRNVNVETIQWIRCHGVEVDMRHDWMRIHHNGNV